MWETVATNKSSGESNASSNDGWETVAGGSAKTVETPTIKQMEANYIANGPQEQEVTAESIAQGNAIEPNEALEGSALDPLTALLGGGVGKAVGSVPNTVRKAVFSRGKKVKDAQDATARLFGDRLKNAGDPNYVDKATYLTKKYAGIEAIPPAVSAVTDTIGKVSPTISTLLKDTYTKLASTVSDTARGNIYRKALKEMKGLGYSESRAEEILSKGITAKSRINSRMNSQLGKSKTKNLSDKAGAMTALFGTQLDN